MATSTQQRRHRGPGISARRIAALRDKAGWTQRQAAELAHVTERQYGRWERGEQAIPGAAWELLTIKAGVDVDWTP